MKKILFLIICFCSFNVVKAAKLEYIELPYYVKLTKNGIDNIIKVKKIYDRETNEVVFSLDPKDYELRDNYIKNSVVNIDNYGRYYNNINFFNSIIYYGYNIDKSDKNYFYTQVIVWNLINSYFVSIVDEFGNEKMEEMAEFRILWNNSIQHDVNPSFHMKEYTINLWDTLSLKYFGNNYVLDNPIIEGLNFTNNGKILDIYATKPGNYKVELSKEFGNINYSYYDGVNYYWQNLSGPGTINKYFKLNVLGISLTINENIVGVNNKIGDAKIIDSQYELYMNNELLYTIDNFTTNYLKPNSNYILKDISNNIGFLNSNDIEINILDDNYQLTIDKMVIAKNLSVQIIDNFTYDIYLKSNNELYERVNSNTDIITLPYGIYYIVCQENDYYKELEILDTTDELLVIDNSIKEIVDDKTETNKEEIIDIEETWKEDVLENINDKNEEPNKDENIQVEEIVNPKTLDNIFTYLSLFSISILMIFISIKVIKND